ncbi:MAG: M1 family aminopeptidase [bacterium]
MAKCVFLHRAVTGSLLAATLAWPCSAAALEVGDSGPTANCPHSFDVIHYGLTLFVDIESEVISGSAVVRGVSEETGLEDIDLDFVVMTVDSVLAEGAPLSASHMDSILSIDLGRQYALGDTFEVEVFYHGSPGNNGLDEMGGFYFEGFPKSALQVGKLPGAGRCSMGRYLFPCWDWPCDKATAEFHITVPGANKKVICSGVLEGTVIDTVANTATYHWTEDHPIATHCVSLHAGRFTDLVDSTYDHIHYFVYPRLVDVARVNFENVAAMLDVFEDAFGPYPFPKCAYVCSPAADVAHQDCIAYPSGAITPDHGNDWHVSQGLARQWWGACVGVGDWRDAWIYESFGRYGQPLFVEEVEGIEAYHDYIYDDLMVHTFNDADPCSPIYDPLHPGGHTIYEKGTVVLHMLRFVLGDSTFFNALKAFRQAHEYGIATTADLQASAEAASGLNLAWFFDEWIYDCGWPEYEYAWAAQAAGSAWDINLVIDQVQEIGPVFTMPLEIGIETALGDTVLTVWTDEQHEEFTLAVNGEPIGLSLDPDRWVLHHSTEVAYAGVAGGGGYPGGLYLEVAPNPTRDCAGIRYCLPAGGHASFHVYDIAGRLVAEVFDGALPAGTGELAWNGRRASGERAAPGTYFCRMRAEGGTKSVPVVLLR